MRHVRHLGASARGLPTVVVVSRIKYAMLRSIKAIKILVFFKRVLLFFYRLDLFERSLHRVASFAPLGHSLARWNFYVFFKLFELILAPFLPLLNAKRSAG